jgi:hypothetical protein
MLLKIPLPHRLLIFAMRNSAYGRKWRSCGNSLYRPLDGIDDEPSF